MFTALALLLAGVVAAKDIHTLKVRVESPRMTCAKCEAKIKNNVRFAKGVKSISTNLKEQVVEVQYDADKGSKEGVLKEFRKLGYTVTVLDDQNAGAAQKVK